MPRQDTLQTGFTSGELTPRLAGRVDVAKYAQGVKRGRDVVIYQHGGATRRPGSDLLASTRSDGQARLVPFVASSTASYMLEFGAGYIRFWRNGALLGAPYEVATPYSIDQVWTLDFTQGSDTMFIFHQALQPYRLRRFGDTRWSLEVAPIDPLPFDEIGRRQATAITLGATGTGSTSATAGAAAFLAADVGRTITHNGGEATITAVGSSTGATVNVTSPFASATLPASEWVMTGSPQTACKPTDKEPLGKITTLTLTDAGWRNDDVGRFVSLNDGLLRITAVASSTVASARIEQVLASDIAAEASAWTLESAVWNAQDGYPCTGTLHQQRLVAGGTPRYPQTIWGSRVGLYLDFQKGTLDDDAYSHELGSDEIQPIRYLQSARDLMAITYGGCWTLSGGIEKPITATNVRAMQQSNVGAAGCRPEQVDNDLFYVQRGKSHLRSVFYSVELGGYDADEMSTLSEHLVQGGITAMTFQQSPERVLWMVKADGTLVALTHSRKQQISAFVAGSMAGGGVIESMATIPEGGEDQTYMVVRRTINGSTRRYVERMNWAACQDCRTVRTLSPASATITGLTAYAGASVAVVADDVDLGDFTVTAGGQVTLPRTASQVTIGFRSTPTIKLLPPEVGTGMGASSGRSVHNGKTSVLFQHTLGCEVNGQALGFRQLGEGIIGNPIDPIDGWINVSDAGWDIDAGEVEITQLRCYPWTILAVVRRITSNPG